MVDQSRPRYDGPVISFLTDIWPFALLLQTLLTSSTPTKETLFNFNQPIPLMLAKGLTSHVHSHSIIPNHTTFDRSRIKPTHSGREFDQSRLLPQTPRTNFTPTEETLASRIHSCITFNQSHYSASKVWPIPPFSNFNQLHPLFPLIPTNGLASLIRFHPRFDRTQP